MRKIDVLKQLKKSLNFCLVNSKHMLILTGINFFFLWFIKFLAGGFSNPLFLPWLILYYIFWSVFFRVVFDKKPYFEMKIIGSSVVPSSKMFILTFIVIMSLIILPVLPLYVALPFDLSKSSIEFIDKYSLFIQKYMEDSETLDFLMSLVFVFLSPIIFYRPFFAWISSLVGGIASIRYAFGKTRGNYWRFFLAGIIMNISIVIAKEFSYLLGKLSGIGFPSLNIEDDVYWFCFFIFLSFLLVFYNVFFAKAYVFFYKTIRQPVKRKVS